MLSATQGWTFVVLNAYEVSHLQKHARTNIPYAYDCESTSTLTRARVNIQVSVMQEKHTEGYKEAVRRLEFDIELNLLN